MTQYYVCLSYDLRCEEGHTYSEGLNQISTIIYELKDIYLWCSEQKIAYVHAPDGFIFNPVRICTAVYIDRIIDATEHPEYHQICLNNIESFSSALYYIPAEWQTPDICQIAIRNDPLMTLCYIKHHTKELCQLAVSLTGHALEYIDSKFRTREICMIAVRRYGNAICYVPPEFITAEICMLAVRQNGAALEFVPAEFKTYDLCVAAVARSPRAIRYIK